MIHREKNTQVRIDKNLMEKNKRRVKNENYGLMPLVYFEIYFKMRLYRGMDKWVDIGSSN